MSLNVYVLIGILLQNGPRVSVRLTGRSRGASEVEWAWDREAAHSGVLSGPRPLGGAEVSFPGNPG